MDRESGWNELGTSGGQDERGAQAGAQVEASGAGSRVRRKGEFLADARVQNPHLQRASVF